MNNFDITLNKKIALLFSGFYIFILEVYTHLSVLGYDNSLLKQKLYFLDTYILHGIGILSCLLNDLQ